MTDRLSVHVPVMPTEVLEFLDPQPGDVVVDGTLGGGGHARLIAERLGANGTVIALDRDAHAVSLAERTLQSHSIRAIHANFRDLRDVLRESGIERVSGVLLDLGMSSDQLADDERGFSFGGAGPLDLRFDIQRGEPAWKLVNRLSATHLANLIYEFGEERHSRRIARRIVERRRRRPFRTSADLADVVRAAIPKRRPSRIDPATRTFQALRIAVNEELKSLEIALERFPECIRQGGRIVVISFHSLEDRRVKCAFRDDDRYQVITRKPISPSASEITENPRSRSARLRAAELKH